MTSAHRPPAAFSRAMDRAVVRMVARAVRSAVVVAALASSTSFAGSGAPEVLGLELPAYSKKLGETRYESPRDWEQTVKFFKEKFRASKTVKWTREVSLPTVKFVHIEANTDKVEWSGINLYALPDGRVRIYVLQQMPMPPTTPASSSSTSPPAASPPPAARTP